MINGIQNARKGDYIVYKLNYKSAWTIRWTKRRIVDEEEVYRSFRRMPPG